VPRRRRARRLLRPRQAEARPRCRREPPRLWCVTRRQRSPRRSHRRRRQLRL
jgi:hypothetical protein